MDDLSRLLRDAVDDVEPAYRLDEIRAAARDSGGSVRRLRWYAAGGATLAVAATLAAVALVGSQTGPRADDLDPVAPPSTAAPDTTPDAGPDPGPSPVPSETPLPVGPESPRPVYYLGDTPEGPRLFRYFEPNRSGEPDHGTATVVGLLVSDPSDPDYRTLWPRDSFAGLVIEPDLAVVVLRDASLRQRPAGMSAAEAELSVQQVVYTVHAAAQERVPVQFVLDGNPIDQVLGVPTSEPLTAAPPLDVLARVNLSDPAEGLALAAGSVLEVTGVANSFEANVVWRLLDLDGSDALGPGSFTAEGYQEARLFPFGGEIDLAGVAPGFYELVVMTDDPSGEGLAHADTRTVVVE